MNIFHILSEIEKVDPEVYERLDSRRSVFKHMAGLGKTLTAAALPMAVGAIFNKAYAQSTAAPSVNDVLNFALKLEYLEAYFYNAGLGAPGVALTAAQTTFRNQFSATNLAALDKIKTDENNHVAFLRTAITNNNGTPIAAPATTEFDYTGGRGSAGGPFAGVLTNPALFLAVAQAFEDTGVRAYKGGAPLLMSNKTVLEAALNIHSVEARHASRLRTMRRAGFANNAASQAAVTNPDTEANRSGLTGTPKSWISGIDAGGPSPAQTEAIYKGAAAQPTYVPTTVTTFPAENNVTQGSGPLPTISGFPALSYSEAFDEPLDVATVSTIARGFTISTSTLF